MDLVLRSSVGHGGINQPDDVGAVKQTLTRLGFDFFAENKQVDAGLLAAIKLYQSIIHGLNRVGGVDGRIDPDGFTNRYLNSDQSPA